MSFSLANRGKRTTAAGVMRIAVALLTGMFATGAARAAEPTGAFAVVSDIHFNPFDPPSLARTLEATDADGWLAKVTALGGTPGAFGEDSNAALFVGSLAELTRQSGSVDFGMLDGDLLVHNFLGQAAEAFGVTAASGQARAFEARTTMFVAEAVKAALGGKPVFTTLGNNDSACGNYRIAPGGGFLAATREATRNLVGAALVAPDFDETYDAGGYYAAKHPTVDKARIVVLNDVLWSGKYENACGTGGDIGGYAMLAWLRVQLAAARAAGNTVWIVQHIPVGIDSYATVHSKAGTCAGRLTPFLKEPFATEYPLLLRDYADVIAGGFVGHMHLDDYRLVLDTAGKPVSLEKVTPAISPIFGQNPAFNLFRYDRATGDVTDFTTVYATNLGIAATAADLTWQPEYSFATAYGLGNLSPASVGVLATAVTPPGPVQDKYRGYYMVSRGALGAENFKAYSCAIANLDAKSFAACYCGG